MVKALLHWCCVRRKLISVVNWECNPFQKSLFTHGPRLPRVADYLVTMQRHFFTMYWLCCLWTVTSWLSCSRGKMYSKNYKMGLWRCHLASCIKLKCTALILRCHLQKASHTLNVLFMEATGLHGQSTAATGGKRVRAHLSWPLHKTFDWSRRWRARTSAKRQSEIYILPRRCEYGTLTLVSYCQGAFLLVSVCFVTSLSLATVFVWQSCHGCGAARVNRYPAPGPYMSQVFRSEAL